MNGMSKGWDDHLVWITLGPKIVVPHRPGPMEEAKTSSNCFGCGGWGTLSTFCVQYIIECVYSHIRALPGLSRMTWSNRARPPLWYGQFCVCNDCAGSRIGAHNHSSSFSLCCTAWCFLTPPVRDPCLFLTSQSHRLCFSLIDVFLRPVWRGPIWLP